MGNNKRMRILTRNDKMRTNIDSRVERKNVQNNKGAKLNMIIVFL
jgi:hypothetical protein